jgi:hypothetical protein
MRGACTTPASRCRGGGIAALAAAVRAGKAAGHAGKHCSVFWPNFLKCDPLLVLSVFSQGVIFQEIRPKKRAMLASACPRPPARLYAPRAMPKALLRRALHGERVAIPAPTARGPFWCPSSRCVVLAAAVLLLWLTRLFNLAAGLLSAPPQRCVEQHLTRSCS